MPTRYCRGCPVLFSFVTSHNKQSCFDSTSALTRSEILLHVHAVFSPGWKISKYDPASVTDAVLMTWERLLYEICYLVGTKDVRVFWRVSNKHTERFTLCGTSA